MTSDVQRSTRCGVSRALIAMAMLLAVVGCRPREQQPYELRMISPSYSFTIIADQTPPHAREAVLYKIIVRDRDSRQPIETGEGQIYANNAERASTWDGFEKGAELGTYYGKLNFVTAGQWAVAVRFRRDSLHKLEVVEWMQDVMNERQSPVP